MNSPLNVQIPGYSIDGEIGEGAMASVYLATQVSLERKVALKVMSQALAADPVFCERFLREGRTLARLSHPSTVTIHDIGNVGELYYMAMEYLPNGTLRERLAEGITPQQGLEWLRQIASALGYAHRQGLVHRDVKPANILFRADGTAVLSDFGIAKSLDDRTQFTQAGFAVGTPSYMSPEQARGQEVDGRADLYALGVVLYEILVGELPYRGTDALSTALAHLTEPLPALPPVHGRYQPILSRLLAKAPDERFNSAEELVAALDALPADDEITLIRPVPVVSPASPQSLAGMTPVSVDIPQAQAVPPAATSTAATRPAAAGKRGRGPLLAVSALALAVALAAGGWWLFKPAGQVPAEAGKTSPSAPVVAQAAEQPAVANGNHPLLMPGKKTLYQRVLSQPGATLREQPGGNGGAAIPTFSVLYVYQRQDHDGQPWLQVGAASDGQPEGWVPASQATDWKQSLVLKFTERSGRDPVMFLRDPKTVERLLANPASARKALAQAQANPSDDSQVLALEPKASAVPQDRFYLLPIFDAKESFDQNGVPVQLLNIASIDPGQAAAASASAAAQSFRTGVVLVVDTSMSMQPYIDQVNEVVGNIQQRMAERGELGSVDFGMVGFRNSVKKTPGLEYLAKTLIPLGKGGGPQAFLAEARKVKATTVNSASFDEDAFAGVMQAVDGMDWSPYGARVILLVTDAGALRKNNPLSSTGMNEAEVRQAAAGKQIKIFALHLQTPAGARDHGFAEQQYRTLTADANPRIGDLYVPVPGGDVARFGERVGEIGSVFADLAHQLRQGQALPSPQLAGAPSLADKSAAVGYAMHMDFLGRHDNNQAPALVSAWTADRDLANPALPAFQVCVLLSKLQLNELQQSLKLIVDAARATKTSPKDFFQQIASASAYMSRDPSALRQGGNLAASGVLGEYLQGLPYRSKVLGMTQDLWLSLSVAEQEDFIDELESKIRLYETFHNDVANWVRFGNAEPGDALYRVPLSTLP
ncbi:serine/threonine-protein kinase PpkA [Pseudomonas sp. URIL14HWK12:I9]|nr:serine/threonine-protein kinase PpkA [Pseudomonas sp. URIL14HWK12:I12]PVZ21497.1 serine/threonine-protein kinase PpkA [Pseudomonas sp. URIL14HWK12:I10]PVZ30322.1 serine/threonine-protein kinase PpkA [Pseudomonas sp. URIL14HWK12:I11]SNZ18619.1 serine/threonine-protein kinase PpkA [Pseudomonas sp. URIL14HWK12:I9]